MKVFIGADHRGIEFKKEVVAIVEKLNHSVIDMGPDEDVTMCDYPEYAQKVANEVIKSRNNRGILLCMSGIGQMIAANKVPGAYAALCYNSEAAELSRQHNNANILVLGSKFIKKKDLKKIIQTWLDTSFEGGRHQRRVNKIKKIEKGIQLKK